MRPLLRYHGGKWRLAPWIIKHLPETRTYVEPYAGAASVLMRKPRVYAEVLNDLDGEIVNLFNVLRDERGGKELLRRLKLTPFARAEFDAAYIVSPRAAGKATIEVARATIIKSLMGFGSDGIRRRTGFRGNVNRARTTPAHDWSTYADALPEVIARLQGVVIENRPAMKIIDGYDGPETLFYVDPPYPLDTRGREKRYRHEMTDAEHSQLLERLRACDAKVAISGYDHPLYRAALHDWRHITKGAFADGARKRIEHLWLNF